MDFTPLYSVEELLDTYKVYRPEKHIEEQRIQTLKNLTATNFEQLEIAVLTLINSGKESQLSMAESILSDLLLWTKFSTDLLLHTLLKSSFTLQSTLLRGAGPKSEVVFRELLKSDPDLGLSGLAWIASSEIVGQFTEWQVSPPEWMKLIPGTPEIYAQLAGWQATSPTEKENLFSNICYGIQSKDPDSQSTTDGSATSPKLTDHCPWCQRQLFRLTNVPTRYLQELFSIEVKAQSITIPFCMYCSGFESVPMQLKDTTGKIEFSPTIDPDKRVKQPNYKLETCGGVLLFDVDDSPRNPFFGTESGRRDNLSQIGGFPNWEQDPDYPNCVKCHQTMVFFLQIDATEFPLMVYEGIYYFFICKHCTDEFAVLQQFT